MQECNGFGCPWIQNRHDENHWVCLRCGKERYIKRTDPVDVIIVGSVIALLLLLSLGNRQPSSTPTSENKNLYPEKQFSDFKFVDHSN